MPHDNGGKDFRDRQYFFFAFSTGVNILQNIMAWMADMKITNQIKIAAEKKKKKNEERKKQEREKKFPLPHLGAK